MNFTTCLKPHVFTKVYYNLQRYFAYAIGFDLPTNM